MKIVAFLSLSILLFCVPQDARAAGYGVSYSFPDQDHVDLEISVDNGGGCVHAGSLEILFPEGTYAPVSIGHEESAFSLWLPDIVAPGSLFIAGGVPGGLCGSLSGEGIVTRIAVIRFSLAADSPGALEDIRFGSSTSLYRADSFGSVESIPAVITER